MSICGRRVKFINTAVLIVCFAMLWSCGGSNVDETPVSDAPAEEAASSGAMVVNPNLAGADELGAISGMSKELIDAIMAQRPFLGMDALHSVVSQHLGGRRSRSSTFRCSFRLI